LIYHNDVGAILKNVALNDLDAILKAVGFLPLLFVVLAISVRLAPEDIAGDAHTRRLVSLRYYWSCEFPSVTM
jgi:hypothetical protein